MTIGLAVLPIVATVGAFCSRRLRATPEGRAFVVVGVSACAAFVTYAAVKGAFLSTVFSLLIVERNVIYLVPVVFAATAALLSRPLASPVALAAGFLVALFLVLNAELRLDQYPYFEAPSLAIGHSRIGTSSGMPPMSSAPSSRPRSSRSPCWPRVGSCARAPSGSRSPSSPRAA